MDERDPVQDSEFVYRRIHRTFFDSSVAIAIRRGAFRPNSNDTTGISVFRAQFVQPAETLARVDPAKAKDFFVARLAVRDLRTLALTVVPDPIAGGPLGHAIVPELQWQAYQARKEQWKPILVELARLASRDIVHQPS